jgi:FKBP-type peptidyl-prolyl cis-trans isomerase FklB
MKLQVIIALSLVLFVSQVSAEEKLMLKDQKDKVSYSIGTNIGNNFKKQSMDINPDALVQGIKDTLSGEKALMTEQEMNETMKAFQQEMMTKQAELAKIIGEKNKTEGDLFLADNKKKEGVITLSSGLQYKVINESSGTIPTLTDKVIVHYRGTLIDGTEFDSSYRRGQPVTFPVNGIIAGWKEALQLMKAGSKWQLFIPPTLAYGERGAGRTIGPNATLIFDIELLSIEEGAKP